VTRLSRYVTELWQGQRNGPFDRLMVLLLLLPSYVYGAVIRLRAWCYRSGCYSVRRLPRPVISVGNLAVGGTGKTPVTAWIARQLLEQGLQVAVLSRGYGGSLEGQVAVVADGQNLLLTPDQCGDEPYLLASTIPGLMVVIGSDRYRAGQLAMERLRPDVFLLDDGFQHQRLQRDLNILLMDCRRPVGNGHVLPAGPLREPASARQRANVVVYTRCAATDAPAIIDQRVPQFFARHRIASFRRLSDDTELQLEQLQGSKVAAFAGIADPQGFFDGLRQRGLELSATLGLADHEAYGSATIARLERFIHEADPAFLLTTEKDGVKLRQLAPDRLPRVVTARLELIFNNERALREAVATAAFKAASSVV
jgi:tetraacyldisaccharide 4'-kinase